MATEFWCDSHGPIVETTAGKIRGYRLDGIYMFRGVKYADADRFKMPRPVKPWDGVKDCLTYGYTAPTIRKPVIFQRDVTHGFRYWPGNEACQYLNIWTKDINNDVKRPVMVWIHGGGYTNGSAIEHKGYEADGLCDYGDVVVVSLNHRLNILGFLNLSDFGGEYENSGNASIADLVAALEWIRDNIAKFGGDPDNVTIFGQSGGGGKVVALLQCPSAAGLFHKAIVQSGSNMVVRKLLTAEDSAKVGRATAEELGLTQDTIDEIQNVPFKQLVAAWKRAARRLDKEEGVDVDWGPCMNDYFIGPPQEVGFTDYAKKVPLMAGSMVAEFPTVNIPDKNALSYDDIYAMAKEKFGGAADAVIAEYKKTYPDKPLADMLFLDYEERVSARRLLDLRCEASDAPCYNYLMTYDFAYNGGLPAWHSADLMLVFHSWKEVPIYHEPGAIKLADEMCKSWASFAHNGCPGNELLPEWPEYSPDEQKTMVFDSETKLRCNFDRKLIELAAENGPARPNRVPYEA